MVFESDAYSLVFFGAKKLTKFQQKCNFAYLKYFTFSNLELGADLSRSRLVVWYQASFL